MTRPVVVDTSSTYFSYNAQTDPLPLIASPATISPEPAIENKGALEIVITVPADDSYTVKSIAFIVDTGTTNALMQNTDELQLTPPDPTWSFDSETLGSQVQFTLMSKDGTSRVLTGTSLFVEIANFLTVQQACTTTVQIIEKITSSEPINPPPTGQGSLTITTFPDGFFFNSLGAYTLDGSAPVAEVANNTQVQLQWHSFAIGTTIWIYSSGNDPVEVPDTGSWNSDPLTEDTVFTVSATQDGVVLTQSVAVTVASPEITATSVTVNGSVTATSVTAGSATINGPLTVVNGLSWGGNQTLPSNWSQNGDQALASGSYVTTTDGFITFTNGGWSVDSKGTGGGTLTISVAVPAPSHISQFCSGTWNPGGSSSGPQNVSSMLFPVFAGQQLLIQLMITSASDVGTPYLWAPQFNFIAFGSGTISVVPDSPAPAEGRELTIGARS